MATLELSLVVKRLGTHRFPDSNGDSYSTTGTSSTSGTISSSATSGTTRSSSSTTSTTGRSTTDSTGTVSVLPNSSIVLYRASSDVRSCDLLHVVCERAWRDV